MESISSSNPLVQYKLLRQVGKGSYGKVYRALERSTNATLASQLVKRVPR
jgi:serine/threonine protein kinase